MSKSRVFITGDVHCPLDIHKLNSICFPIGQELTKEDILIICGDGGFVWSGDEHDKWGIDWITRKPWTTVYVCGNHENFDLLKEYPVVDFYGAKAHQLSPSLYHVLRGEVMVINGESFFCFGGAFSHDREYRVENISWWQAELPTRKEIENAWFHLGKYQYQVDYVISHDIPGSIHTRLGYDASNMGYYDQDQYVDIGKFFDEVLKDAKYKKWFAGHYHINRDFSSIQILYDDIVEVAGNGKYVVVPSDTEKIMQERYAREELIKRFREEKLYISYNKIDKEENFGHQFSMAAQDFFEVKVTSQELEVVCKMYNQYKIKEATWKE